ncbi:hypothetical protein HORIV_40040 [Vreelandella olivaria]|uniref:Uncharacterized protein n=1 Tax=Vreelandella olivaria TaxID=390919 RepID=A0ABM7GLM2_9GAMM|nr:hypothetical protein HORIV_40040 [Halomonas olivaria]
MPKMLSLLFVPLLLMLSTQALSHKDDAEAAALAWLEAIDSGQYEQAWEASSPLLKSRFPHTCWSGRLVPRGVILALSSRADE